MRRRSSEEYALVLLVGAFFLVWIFRSVYEEAVKKWLLQRLAQAGYSETATALMSGLAEIVPAITLAGLVVYGLHWYIRREFRKTASAFSVAPHVYAETRSIHDENGNETPFYEAIFFLVVGNGLTDGRTLRRTQMRIAHYGAPVIANVRDSSALEIDLRHGEWAFFEIGRIVSKEVIFGFAGHTKVDASQLRSYQHNVPNGYLSFELRGATGRSVGLGHQPDYPHVWELRLIVSADEVISTNVIARIDFANRKSPVSIERLDG
jgi:hypothetical protein